MKREWAKLKAQIDEYFEIRQANEKPVSVSGLASFIGIDRHTLAKYKENKDYSAAVKKAYARIEGDMEDRLLAGKPPIGLIFSLKNNFGWSDKQNIDITSDGKSLGVVMLPPKSKL